MSELKIPNCPFCGGKPKKSLKLKFVCCSNLDCPCSMTWFSLIAWNTRENSGFLPRAIKVIVSHRANAQRTENIINDLKAEFKND